MPLRRPNLFTPMQETMSHTSFLPFYDFSPTLNANYLKEIVPLLVRHSIAANPINYAIFYDYVANTNPDLSETINGYLKQQKSFDCDTSLQLYQKYICNTSLESLEKINQKIHAVIAQTSGVITETYNKAEESNISFNQKSALLESSSEAGVVKSILQEIIAETRSLATTSHDMQAKLNLANQEMDRLRAELSQVKQIASTDGLTGLLNRRAFDEALAEVIAQPQPQSTFLSLLDIDYFKRVNDTYGHTIGDNVIKYVASLMKKYVESHHRVARYGGEELAIIMPDTSIETALEIAENIRKAMESSRLKRKDNDQPIGTITLSIGIAALQSGDDSERFIERTDKALYQAKQSGRNRIVQFA